MHKHSSSSNAVQVFTAVEDFGSTCVKLTELGLKVNAEESELVYRVSVLHYL